MSHGCAPVPGVGPVTATAFVATLDTWERLEGPHQVEAYLGVAQSPACGCRCERGFVMWSGEDSKGQEWTLNRRPIGDQRARRRLRVALLRGLFRVELGV